MTDAEVADDIGQRIDQITEQLQSETFRGKILILTTEIDERLKEALSRFLLPPRDKKSDELFSMYKPLSTFSSRIDMTYRLAIIPDYTCKAYHSLRQLRNKCAHLSALVRDAEWNKYVLSLKDNTLNFPPVDKNIRDYFAKQNGVSEDRMITMCCIFQLWVLEKKLINITRIGV